mmetsp:Transcript_11991/g.17486  ORF Transcript_11991/g.17486 Transcript_11991/m.17486 type:complete len:235 (+) Transcript_11991:248-952(+)
MPEPSLQSISRFYTVLVSSAILFQRMHCPGDWTSVMKILLSSHFLNLCFGFSLGFLSSFFFHFGHGMSFDFGLGLSYLSIHFFSSSFSLGPLFSLSFLPDFIFSFDLCFSLFASFISSSRFSHKYLPVLLLDLSSSFRRGSFLASQTKTESQFLSFLPQIGLQLRTFGLFGEIISNGFRYVFGTFIDFSLRSGFILLLPREYRGIRFIFYILCHSLFIGFQLYRIFSFLFVFVS